MFAKGFHQIASSLYDRLTKRDLTMLTSDSQVFDWKQSPRNNVKLLWLWHSSFFSMQMVLLEKIKSRYQCTSSRGTVLQEHLGVLKV
jgi:hypothetical protein